MKVPEKFKPIFRKFRQESDIIYGTPQEMASLVVKKLNLKDNIDAKIYFDELLSGRYTQKELQDLWFNSGAGIYFENNTLVPFLKMMRSMMD